MSESLIMSSTNERKDKTEASAREADPDPSGEGSVAHELTAEQFEHLKEKAGKAEEYWERLLRTTADLENSKKRAARERQDAIRFANESLITGLIPVLDSFEMAMAAADTGEGAGREALKTGVTMILSQLKKALAEAGLGEVDASRQPFDPNLHEAVSQEASTEVPDGHVIRQLRKGYKLHDRLIRPATVVVAHNSPV